MINALWLLLAFLVGAIVGILLICIISGNRE